MASRQNTGGESAAQAPIRDSLVTAASGTPGVFGDGGGKRL